VWNLGYEQYSPNTKINTAAGGLVGLLVGLLVVFFLEWLEQDVIRTAGDVERTVQVTVVGVIPPRSEENNAKTQSRRAAKNTK
jgi:capsular polysaccharide biosynthesis protein